MLHFPLSSQAKIYCNYSRNDILRSYDIYYDCFQVDIRILDVEFNHLGKVFDGGEEDVKTLMEEAGYDFNGKVGIDAIFVKRGTLAKKRKKKEEN